MPQTHSSKIELRVLMSHHTASMRQKVPSDDLAEAMGRFFQKVREALAEQGMAPDGAPFARYHAFGDTIDLEAGVIVSTPCRAVGQVKPSTLPAGPAAIAVHSGPYETLGATYASIESWVAASRHQPNGAPWELYITDPSAEPDASRWIDRGHLSRQAGLIDQPLRGNRTLTADV